MTKEEFKLLYNQYFDAIRNYVYYRSGGTHFSSDIAQEVFIKVWQKQFNYEPHKLKSLLYKMANNAFIDRIRREKIEAAYLTELKFGSKSQEGANPIEFKELKTQYENVLNKLTEKQRITFLMSRYEQLSYREIAERLAISQKAVEKRISETLKVFRLALKSNDAKQ